MQNSHSFKSYSIDPSQVAGFKSTLQNLDLDSGTATPKTGSSFDASSFSGYQKMSNDQSKTLESNI